MMFVKRLKRVKFGETKITVISRFVTAATSSSTQAAVRVCLDYKLSQTQAKTDKQRKNIKTRR